MVTVSASSNRQIFLYFTSLTLIVYLVAPENPLLDIPVSYMLKNQLHATAAQVSIFRLLIVLPMYLAFVFGLAQAASDRASLAAEFLWQGMTGGPYASGGLQLFENSAG